MGWTSEDTQHEGYLVPVVRDAHGLWRELGYPHDEEPRSEGIHAVQVACACGWRSRRFFAPFGTSWFPYSIGLPKAAAAQEDHARAMWSTHVQEEQQREHELRLVDHQSGWLRPAP